MNTNLRNGFSLIELMVVFLIVAVLIGILLPAVQSVREAAKMAECQHNLQQMGRALYGFHDAKKAFPKDENVSTSGYQSAPRLPNQWSGSGKEPIRTSRPYSSTYFPSLRIISGRRGTRSREVSKVQATPIKIFLCPSRRTIGVGTRTTTAMACIRI